MSLRSLLNTTCTISRPTFSTVSGIQDEKVTYANSSTSVPVRLEPSNTQTEDTIAGRVFSEFVTLTFDINADVKHRDRVIIGSDTYEVLELLDYTAIKRYYTKTVRALKKVDN